MGNDNDNDDNLQERNVNFWIIVNWKTGEVRVRKTEVNQSKVGTYEIPIEFELDIQIPKEPSMKVEGTIELGKEKVSNIIAKQLKEGIGDDK